MTWSPGEKRQPNRSTLRWRVERGLKLDVQRPCTHAASVHRTKHLDVLYWIEAEPLGIRAFYELDNTRQGGFGIVRLHEVEVVLGSGRAQIGVEPWLIRWALVMMRLCAASPNTFGKAYNRNGTR